MPGNALDDLRRLVQDDPRLREHLLATTDQAAFTEELVKLARHAGIALSVETVVAELRAARLQWLMRGM